MPLQRPPHLRRILGIAALLLAVASSGHAVVVSGVKAEHRNGQTFITWDNLPGTGWVYRVVRSGGPLQSMESDDVVEIAQVGGNSAVDERISSLLGQTLTYRIDEKQPPLAITKGLFVHTPRENTLHHYSVFAEKLGLGTDYTIVPGQNSTLVPVVEAVTKPRPVWQRSLTSPRGEDYVLWTTNVRTPVFPAMGNTPGRAWHVGVIPGARNGALVLHGHGRGGNFFNSFIGTGMPGEWVVSIDDYLPTGDYASFYFGYEENYDLEQPINAVRNGGLVVDYTEQRVLYLLDWANETMPHDPKRVYAMGVSMGGSFAFFLAWHHPERIAGALSVIPKICLGYQPDVFPELRSSLDRMWGSPDMDLPTTAGPRVFQWMDGREQARIARHRGSAPIVAFAGINDDIVGWQEKVAYFQQMEHNKAGGAWFWDTRDHYTTHEQTEWFPMMATRQLYKYRNDQSYPAFSSSSANSFYGDGDPVTADPIGNLNGALDWDEFTLDEMWVHWKVTLRTKSLRTLDGVMAAPESVTVDVTPRRLQRFLVATGVTYKYEVRALDDDRILQQGQVMPDGDAVLTIPGVKVYAEGVRLVVYPSSTAGVTPEGAARFRPHLALSRNPVAGKASLTIEWPASGDAVVETFDMQGRRVRTEFRGHAERGFTEHTFRGDGLAPGLYMVQARMGKATATRRVTVLN